MVNETFLALHVCTVYTFCPL